MDVIDRYATRYSVLNAVTLVAILSMIAASGVDAVAAETTVGQNVNGGVIVPTKQLIRPAGKTVEFKGRPIDLAVAPDGKHVFLKDNSGIVVIETESWQVTQELKLKLPEGGSMHGILLSRDGRRLYATGSGNMLFEATIGSDATVKLGRRITMQSQSASPNKPTEKQRTTYPCGIAACNRRTTNWPYGITAFQYLAIRWRLNLPDGSFARPKFQSGVAPVWRRRQPRWKDGLRIQPGVAANQNKASIRAEFGPERKPLSMIAALLAAERLA